MKDHNDDHAIEDIDCMEAINGLYAYLDGEMDDPVLISKIENHLCHCRSCYSRTEFEKTLSERLRKTAGEQTPERLHQRLRNLIDRF
jgi:anti-sigma factor (TIGR02949 family)